MAEKKPSQVQLAVANKPGGGKPSEAKAGNRPSVVSLNYPDKKSLQKAYMSFLKGGGLFVPTSSAQYE